MAIKIIQRFGQWFSGADYRQKGSQSGKAASSSIAPAMPVTTDSALQISAAWACVRLIAETVSSLPIKIYELDENGARKEVKKHDIAKLFSGKVNKWQTKQEFFETMLYQLAIHGNCYAVKQYANMDKRNKIIGLVPLMSEQMTTSLDDNNNIVHKYVEGQNTTFFAQDSIWHIKLMGNAVIGLSPLSYAKGAVGIAMGAEKAVADIYRNGGKTSGVLTIDRTLTKEQREQIKQNFAGVAEGNDNRLFVLEAGMQYQAISLSPQDIELLSSRRFQIEEICRFFGVPSVLVNDTSAGTTWGSGIEQIVQGWYKLGLRPYLERIEASAKVWLFSTSDRMKYDIEFDFNALLRSDQSSRIKTYKEAVQGGIMTPNEARRLEGLTDQNGGDKLFMQQQMTPIDMLPVKNPMNDTNKGNN